MYARKNSFNLAKQSLQVAEKQLLRSRQFSFSNNEGSGLPAGGGAHNQQLRN